MDISAYLLIVTSVAFSVVAVMHFVFGVNVYVRGKDSIFRNKEWDLDSDKNNTMLGVFFMISFAWMQASVLTIYLVLLGNSPFVAVTNLISALAQLFLVQKYIRWNYVVRTLLIAHSLSSALYLFL